MDNTKVRRTKEEWLKLVEEYRKSGQVLAQWCEEHGINRKTMSGYTHMKPAQNANCTSPHFKDNKFTRACGQTYKSMI